MPKLNVNGCNIYYEVRGNENSNDVVVFLNGVMATFNSWGFQIPVFEKGFKILLHDFRGQLLSDKPKGPYSFKMHADDLKALLDHVGIKKAHIIGTSYGGEVGIKFAIEYPEMVKSLAIIDSVSEVDDLLRMFALQWRQLAVDKDPIKFYYGMLPSIYGNTFIKNNRKFLETRGEGLKNVDPSYFDGQVALYDTFLTLNLTPELHKIKAPTIVVVGEDDILKRRKLSDIIVNNIPKCEYVIIPDCGHVTIFEKPDTLNSILLGFVTKNL
ncbi:MAG TPA: alpha/beta hydrolase [Spirochaetota bacterium]|nr:alpha/beta hydrolase [Spirochaetota bacterium]HOM37601.1 alpha/beta hydrolase [Spirochaetota bacterium]HPQ49428.1 alpha/beta hydrolase [Spirochaetota bacterium]